MAVLVRDDSASTFQLPARPVVSLNQRTAKKVPRNHFRTSSQEEQALRTGVGMQYTILRDPPWVAAGIEGGASQKKKNNRVSDVSSMYSDDMTPGNNDVPQPLTFNKRDPYHAHPTQKLTDSGLQMRSSRLPIFQQVRHMLHKPPPIHTGGMELKWDEYSGELDENGKPAQVKPSAYVNPYEGVLKSTKKQTAADRPKKKRDMRRDVSPVSMLNENDLAMHDTRDDYTVSPVSPVSRSSSLDDRPPSPIIHNPRSRPAQYLAPPAANPPPIRRKPVVATLTPITSAAPSFTTSHPRTPSDKTDWPEQNNMKDEESEFARQSRFSWTTYTNSILTGRPSTDMTPPMPQHGFDEPDTRSHFSWTTINTATTTPHHHRPVTSPLNTPPQLPPKVPESPPTTRIDSARGPPVQSILSRSRPVQKAEMEEPVPAMRIKTSLEPNSISTLKTHTKTNSMDETIPSGNAKKLPLPPELNSTASHMTHMESLQAQDRSLATQRTNTIKAIGELEKLEKASPLDVPFSMVRDAKKRLEEYRLRLSEVERDIREVGIAISRLRRKDGQENGLWVRRVTG